MVRLIDVIPYQGQPKCDEINLENFPTLRHKDLFARISFLKDIHLDETNKDIKAWFFLYSKMVGTRHQFRTA